MIASVVVDIETNAVDRTFDYLVPDYFLTSIAIGQRVSVPFGPQQVLGFVVDLKETSDFEVSKLKKISEILDLIPCLNQELVTLANNMHNYYFTLYITCLLTMIPQALRAKYTKKFVCKDLSLLPEELKPLFKGDSLVYTKKEQVYLPYLQKGLKAGYLTLENEVSDKANVKTLKYLHLNEDYEEDLNPNQKEITAFLELEDLPKRDCVDAFSLGRINTLLKKGVLSEYEQEVYRAFDENTTYVDKVVTFNQDQQKVYEELKAGYDEFNTYLLHGVTGSGKTEIYLQVIEDVIKKGKTAIFLVPEISLTPQIVGRIKGRFKDDVAVLHSGLSIGEKYDEWRKVLNAEVKIVVGARSAIFAPLKNIGVIIIDEEHETSYKQDTNPRYDAKMIARIRAKTHQCPCILGSATPSIETYYQSELGRFKRLELLERANHKPSPKVKLVNMVNELKKGNHSLFSTDLQNLLKDRLQKHEQTILLLNRRGFSNFVMCRECGEVIKCPHCDVSLTYHKNDNSLKCHYCGYKIPNVKTCPSCHSTKIRFVGGGTEKVCEELTKLFPTAKVLRMDMDNTKNKGAHERIIRAFMNEEADILVGTQMVAKGLDFKKCSLVGVLNSDLALKYPSYDAPSQAYNLFVQVSGRAGRHETDGLVVIQAYDPDHYVLQNALKENYRAFYEEEIKYRKLGNYPPFVKLALITVLGKSYDETYGEALNILKEIKQKLQVQVLGPAEDFIVKLNDLYRFIITIKFTNEGILNTLLTELYVRYLNDKKFKIMINRT